MEHLFEKQEKKFAYISMDFIRGDMDRIHWNERMVGIKGARGVGKTTILLQKLKNLPYQRSEKLYVSLDDIWFTENTLVNLADNFVKHGGKYLFIDEVHRYKNWSLELKNIYDDHPDLNIVFTGSSLLEIINARADLSRRTVNYQMQGLSFREYLNLIAGTNFKVISLEEILHNHIEIAAEIVNTIKPFKFFPDYLKWGYYPFFLENKELYHIKLEETISMILQIELPLLRNVDVRHVDKIKLLLKIFAEAAPFIPNISKISERSGINRNTLVLYLRYLNEAGLINILLKQVKGIRRLQKPDKLLLENTNISYTIDPNKHDAGGVRETFFVNQLKFHHGISLPETGDFLVNGKYLFEIGGRQKSPLQLKGWNKDLAYVAADDIEYGTGNKIPLWLFGFLY